MSIFRVEMISFVLIQIRSKVLVIQIDDSKIADAEMSASMRKQGKNTIKCFLSCQAVDIATVHMKPRYEAFNRSADKALPFDNAVHWRMARE
jgi:hypothetical protein